MAFKLGMTVDVYMSYMHVIYAHAHFYDLELDARSQWLIRGTKSVLNYLDKQ